MPARPLPHRFTLPEWAHRTLLLCGPGRPLAPSAEAWRAGLSLSPATAHGLLHAVGPSAWSGWSDPEPI